MAYLKHPVHGNRNAEDSEVEALVADGWVQWPRSKEEKALGDGSAAAYWRAKYERDIAAHTKVEIDADSHEAGEPAKKRGRPFKAV